MTWGLALSMDATDNRLNALILTGLLSSMLLLSASSPSPAVSVAELPSLGEEPSVTVLGLVVSLRRYDSGTEVLVISDGPTGSAAKVVCTPGPGLAPSSHLSIGDLVSVRARCTFEGQMPVLYCDYGGLTLVRPSDEAMTVSLLSSSWHLLVGDRFLITGLAVTDQAGAWWLQDLDSAHRVQMRLRSGAGSVSGPSLVDCTLLMDASTMSLFLDVWRLEPAG